ncbi:S49 family peptidase [Altibacter sp. HG106]|uniref:S49 family peptidase n=1 Tax=Altibacter sp. HG106 TaxID=3023937 RepID=UPI002350C846|nr:S49 family peptidase [Altibacter sp. HG106]MDC7994454.1 S49 family peptidase [Altibacter sp. HG106]
MLTNSQVLHEIMHEEWLMNFSSWLQLRDYMEKVVASGAQQSRKKQEGVTALDFYSDDLKKIRPERISDIPEGSVAVVKMVGPMMKYWSWWFQGADEVVAQLDFANDLQNIACIIAVIDGPGGAVSAIPPFIDFARRKKKPIVALMDQSLSLHRWIPDAIADHQMADNDIVSRFGSIGVMSSWMYLGKYYEDLKIVMEEVYPEESKHKNEVWRLYKEDPEKGKALLRKMRLAPMAQKFQGAVKAAHPNLIEEEGVLTGRTFSAEDAVRINMIDSIGNMEEAMSMGLALAELS